MKCGYQLHMGVARPDCRLQKRPPHACGVVSNGCCDVSAPRGAVFKLSPAPLPPPKPAIACRSCDVEPELPMEPVGGSAAKPPSCQFKPTAPVLTLCNTRSDAPAACIGAMPANCQSRPTVPMKAAPASWLLLMS